MVVPILCQNPVGIALRIIKLTGFHRPKERNQTNAAKEQRNRDQDRQDFHHFSLSALTDTVIDEIDMASAAAKGVA